MSVYKLKRKTGANTTEDIQLDYNSCIANKPSTPVYVEGATTGTSPIWTATSSAITSYQNGMIIAFKIGIAGLSGTQTTLNINNLGAKKVFENVSTNPSTHYSVGTILIMTYDSSADSNAGAWKISGDRVGTDSQNVRTYNYTGSNYDRDLLCRQDTAAITDGSYAAKYVASTTKASINTSTGKITAGGFATTNGTSSQFLKADGSVDNTTIPTKTSDLVNDSGYTTNTGTITKVQLNGEDVASSGTANVKALPNFNLTINHQSAGNPRMVKFASVNYTSAATCFKMSAMTCHDNGVSYQFLTDMLIAVTTSGEVTANIYKFAQQSIGSVDGVDRYTGDVFYVNDTTNKIVDFYILCGQWSSSQFTPATKVGSTTIAYVTQYSGNATYYSSGTKVWVNGCGSTYARTSDVPSVWYGTQQQYDAIANKDSNTYYYIQEA